MIGSRTATLALLGVALATQVQAQQNYTENLPFTTLTRLVQGGPVAPVRAVITTPEQYARFFQTQVSSPVDFSQEQIVVVHLGTQGSAGYRVQIQSVVRENSTPPVVTVSYAIAADTTATTQLAPVTDSSVQAPTPQAPAEVIKLAVFKNGERLRFNEVGGQERVGFNTVQRSLRGKDKNELVTVDFTGGIKVKLGDGAEKEGRVLLAELDHLSAAVRAANLATLPRTVPTETFDGTRFGYAMQAPDRTRTIVEGTLTREGEYADRIRPLHMAFDLILARLENRPVDVWGTVQTTDVVDVLRVRTDTGLVWTLRGPLVSQARDFNGRKVQLRCAGRLVNATSAEGVLVAVAYPQRQQLGGIVVASGGQYALQLSAPMPDIPLPLTGARANDLVSPELGKQVFLDMWIFFDDKAIPNEGMAVAIRAVTKSQVTLRDRPDAVSLPTGDVAARQTIWVSERKGGATGLAHVAGQKSGWTASEFLNFNYMTYEQGLRDAMEHPAPTPTTPTPTTTDPNR
jgi:hypothetical protein